MPKHSDDEPSISPESQIFTLSLSDTCTVTFSDKCTSNELSLNVADNSIYSMNYKSQLYWQHQIDKPVLSELSV